MRSLAFVLLVVWAFVAQAQEKPVSLSKRVETVALNVLVNPLELPSTALHESMHKAAFKVFGVRSSIEVRNALPWIPWDTGHYSGLTIPNEVDYEAKIRPHPWKQDVVSLAPYVVGELVLRDRFLEHALRHRFIRIVHTGPPSIPNIMLVEWAHVMIVDQMFSPLWNVNGDIKNAAPHLKLNKWVLAGGLQILYTYSALRVINAGWGCRQNFHC
jgi:hypothetical protein